MNYLIKSETRFIWIIIVFIITSILHINTFAGLDSDFQAYSLHSKLIFLGQKPYVDFFSMKPPLYLYILLPGNFLGGKFISFFIVHLIVVGLTGTAIFYAGANITKPTI